MTGDDTPTTTRKEWYGMSTSVDLPAIFTRHAAWLAGTDSEGRADLRGVYLRCADLQDAVIYPGWVITKAEVTA